MLRDVKNCYFFFNKRTSIDREATAVGDAMLSLTDAGGFLSIKNCVVTRKEKYYVL